MKFTSQLPRWALSGLLALGVLCALGGGLGAFHPKGAHAQTNAAQRVVNRRTVGYTETLVNTSSATTTPVVAFTATFTPINDPNSYSVPGYVGGSGYGKPYEHIRVQWSLDGTKATSTVGSCEVYVNGALYTASKRSTGYAGGEDTISGVLDVANTVTGAQNVQLQCFSADTATFTLTAGSFLVEEIY